MGSNFAMGSIFMGMFFFKPRLVYECGGVLGLQPQVRTLNHGKLLPLPHVVSDISLFIIRIFLIVISIFNIDVSNISQSYI